MKIKDIEKKHIGQKLSLSAKITSIVQTSGPTIFQLEDETGSISATAFTKPGKRVFPDLEKGTTISAEVSVKEHEGEVELQLEDYTVTLEPAEKSVNPQRKFMIESGKLEKMRSVFVSAASTILQAVQDNRPIMIRHHDDTDGYSAGLALEMALRPLVNDAPYALFRISSRTPFYDYIDALRDLNGYLIGKNRHKDKPPLIIITDLGSNEQSLKAIRRLKPYGIDFVIVDHHRYDEANESIASVFLNPHTFGFGSDLNAGALASELAQFINPIEEVKHLPALSGIADKSSGEELEAYIALSGRDRQFLEQWALVVDHETYHLRFSESSEFLQDLLLNPAYVERMFPLIEEEFKNIIKAVNKYARVKKYDHFKLITIEKDKIGHSYDYPSSKLTRIAHDTVEGPRITLATSKDGISFREDGVAPFSVVGLMQELRKSMPYGMITGGGHDSAGTIRCSRLSFEEMMKHVESYLKDMDSNL